MSNFNTTSNQNHTINPKPFVYNCNTQIYWNTAKNEYWEVFTKKKHICLNRQQQNSKLTNTTTTAATTTGTNRPTYYSKKP